MKQYGGDGVLERLPGRPEEDGRWCEYCNLPKPLRTHQCVTFSLRSALEARELTIRNILASLCSSSAAGTCVRKFDHFCPWIGQEVGQLNQKVR